MPSTPQPRSSELVQRRLVVILAVSFAVFVATFLLASFFSYPSSVWWVVMSGIFLPPPVAAVTAAMLVQHRWRSRSATA